MSTVLSKIQHFFFPAARPLAKPLHDQYRPLFTGVLKTVENVGKIERFITEGRWGAFDVQNKPSKPQRIADYAMLRRNLKVANKMNMKAFAKSSKHDAVSSDTNVQLRLRLNMADWKTARRAEKTIGEILQKYEALLNEQECNATERFGPAVTGQDGCLAIKLAVDELRAIPKNYVVSPRFSPLQAIEK